MVDCTYIFFLTFAKMVFTKFAIYSVTVNQQDFKKPDDFIILTGA